MKKPVILFLLCAVAFTLPAQQIPPDWDTSLPRDTAATKYSVGISQPSATEQEAVKSAWQNALQTFASSIGTHFEGQTDISVQSESYSSGIEDAFTVYLETSSFSTNVRLTGVREMARKIERSNGRYIARILAAMSVDDYNKALQYVENEESAFLAYRFFAQKGLFGQSGGGKPAGFEDYYSWLRNNCVTVFVNDSSQNAYLEQIDIFIKKLYKNAVTFAELLDGRGARIIYNSAKYYDGILRALQGFGLFNIARENAALVLTPIKPGALAEFRNLVAAMKDASLIFVTGLEVIDTGEGLRVNTGNLVVNQFKALASRRFGLRAANYSLPAAFTEGPYLDEAAIIAHIQGNIGAFPARYAAICYTETAFEPGLAVYKMPALITAQTRFTVYDVLTGETSNSNTVDTQGFAFSPADGREQSVLAESRRALQFLYDAKNKPGLEGIMADVLGEM
jgi:hypothetical protein